MVTVSERLVVVPAAIFPKLRLAGLAPSWPRVTPVPDSDTFRVEFDAVDAIARLPVTLPAVVGVKITLKLMLWPALKDVGKVKPLVLNSDDALAAEMVMLFPLEFVRVSASVCELFSETLVKPKLDGVAVSWPEVIPVPDNGKVTDPSMPSRLPRFLLEV